MQKALQDAMAPDGVWEQFKEKGRIHQTCTRFAGRLIDAVARHGNAVCALLLRLLCAFIIGRHGDDHSDHGGRRLLRRRQARRLAPSRIPGDLIPPLSFLSCLVRLLVLFVFRLRNC